VTGRGEGIVRGGGERLGGHGVWMGDVDGQGHGGHDKEG
jgi:hypothetical protein